MKKLIIASAVASALAAPVAAFADAPTVYGNFRYTVADIKTGSSSTLTAVNNASRLGVKGSIGGDSGLTGFYHMQMGAENDASGTALSSRFYFAGVKGSFGKVLVGRASSPYKMAAVSGGFDPFYDTSAGPTNSGSSFGLSDYTNGFFDNVVAFLGKAGAISYNAVAVLDDSVNNDHHTNIGASWSGKDISVGLQVLEVTNTASAKRLSGTYKMGNVKLSANIENIDRSKASGGKGDLMFVGANFKLNASSSVQATYGSATGSLTSTREKKGTGYSLGYSLNLAKKTTVRFILSNVDYDTGSDRTTTGVMLVQSF